jgi:hypothetical protein
MKTRCSIVTVAVGVTLALASAAQADRWGQDRQRDRSQPSSKTFAVNQSSKKTQKAAHLRAQHQAIADFWRLGGAARVAGGTEGVDTPAVPPARLAGGTEGVYTPGATPAATPESSATPDIGGTACAPGDWLCG